MSDTAEEYRRYLRRCEAHQDRTPLSHDEYESLLARLDDLLLLGLERHLTAEEGELLAILTALLLDDSRDLDIDLDGIDDPEPPQAQWTAAGPRHSRMGSPCPDAATRRERWRQQRRSRG